MHDQASPASTSVDSQTVRCLDLSRSSNPLGYFTSCAAEFSVYKHIKHVPLAVHLSYFSKYTKPYSTDGMRRFLCVCIHSFTDIQLLLIS